MSVDEGVPQHQLVALEELVVLAYFVPLGRLEAKASQSESTFELAELFDESSPDFKIWPSRIEEL